MLIAVVKIWYNMRDDMDNAGELATCFLIGLIAKWLRCGTLRRIYCVREVEGGKQLFCCGNCFYNLSSAG